jgi:hypothetical protein
MSKTTAQLRTELDRLIADHDAYVQNPGGGLVGSMSRLEGIRDAARALSAHLAGQPSRRGKPYRITFVHQKGALAGQVFKNSVSDLSQAAAHMRTVISVGGRVALSIRDDSGEWHEKDALYLSAMGYNDIAGSEQYADTLEALGA